MKVAERAKRHREDKLLQRAFRALGFVRTDSLGFITAEDVWYYAYDKHDFCDLDKTDNIAKLGEIAIFDNPGVHGVEAIKNPFFGVKSAEELAVRLDLMGA